MSASRVQFFITTWSLEQDEQGMQTDVLYSLENDFPSRHGTQNTVVSSFNGLEFPHTGEIV